MFNNIKASIFNKLHDFNCKHPSSNSMFLSNDQNNKLYRIFHMEDQCVLFNVFLIAVLFEPPHIHFTSQNIFSVVRKICLVIPSLGYHNKKDEERYKNKRKYINCKLRECQFN